MNNFAELELKIKDMILADPLMAERPDLNRPGRAELDGLLMEVFAVNADLRFACGLPSFAAPDSEIYRDALAAFLSRGVSYIGGIRFLGFGGRVYFNTMAPKAITPAENDGAGGEAE